MMQRFKAGKHVASALVFAAAFVVLLVYSLLFQGIPNGSDQPYDAGGYMTLSETFFQNGSFSLFHYPASIRGYLFPLLICLFRAIFPFFSPNLCVLIMNCAALAAFVAWTLPAFTGKKILQPVPYIAFTCLLLFFWSDLLPYALTDFYAFWWLLVAALLVERCRRKDACAWQGLICGMLAYAAYNLRPNLSFSLAALLIWLLYCTVRKPRQFMPMFLLFLLGMLLTALPQMLLNRIHLGSLSPTVPTESFDGQGLTLYYLNNGLIMRRYETYAGDPNIFHRSTMIFSNDSMLRLLEADGITAFESLGDYILFVLRHPFECIAVYAEHLINLLTPVFGRIFVTDFYGFKVPRILINFALFVIAAADWMLRQKPLKAMHEKGRLAPVIVLLVSVLPVIAGKVETRYALPMYLFVYLYVCWHVDYKRLWTAVRNHPWHMLCILAAVLCAYCTILSTTFASFEGPLMRLL